MLEVPHRGTPDRAGHDRRLDQLIDHIVLLAGGDLGVRLEPSAADDHVDAAMVGLNLLADELATVHRRLEDRVAERTARLDEARRQLERLALYDPLTGLANRTLLGDRMGRAAALAEGGAGPPCVLLADLDEFKTINDGLGHGAGDQILVEVARRLASVVRDVDTVARLGGDEFAILLPGVGEDQALRIAERALGVLLDPFTVSDIVGDRTVRTGASIGVCFGTRGQSPEHMLQDADTAMYAAKAGGRARVQVFRPDMHHAARARLQTAADLATAVTADPASLSDGALVAGSRATFRVTTTDNGPSDARTVGSTITLPAGTTPVSAAPSVGTCTITGQQVQCTQDVLPGGSTATVTLTVDVAANATGPLDVRATAQSALTAPQPGNNPSNLALPVTTAADLTLALTGVPDPVRAGTAETYTALVTNNGPSDAAGVTFAMPLPPGFTVVPGGIS